jgi:7,8-dihydropterin-6-yl-methyl-4-(beta-D-ribofuranosyl)aminobenzene 5'-phosphate synthase
MQGQDKDSMKSHLVSITIVVDNQAGPGLATEHGLALHIESAGRHILFDTGQGRALPANARSLGIALEQIDTQVLSHGHYDHTGGLAGVLRAASKVDLYCHPGVTQPRYAIRNGKAKPIQMPHASMAAMDKVFENKMHWVLAPVMLGATIGITGPIPRKSGFEDTGGPFFLDPEGRRADPIDDDLALWIATDRGLVVCVGCCHAGLVNTLNHVRHLNANAHIHAVIGGFHLLQAGGQRLERTIATLRSVAPEMVVPCHCTGEQAVAAFGDALGNKVRPGAAGMTLQF